MFESFIDMFSMAIVSSKTAPINAQMTIEEKYNAVFAPIVRPNMLASWNENWKKWFCTTGTIEENLTPGKLKCKSFQQFFNV